MKTDNRVAWTEGMFLRVQHFQQADRWAERMLRDRTAPLRPYPWGFTRLEIDRSALGVGRVALSGVTGVLADGTPVSAPDLADLPAPVQLTEGSGATTVYLAVRMAKGGQDEYGPAGANVGRHMRMEFEAEDANADTAFTAAIEVGRLELSLKTDQDEREGFECLPFARVVETRTDLSVVLDDTMIPPVMQVGASPRLRGYLSELVGLLRHRSAAIAQRIGDPSIRGAAEIGDYMMLQALNRATPLIGHLEAQAGQIHPERMFADLVALAGELATFTAPDSIATQLPDYAHTEPEETFAPVMDELRRALSAVLDQSATSIPLEMRRHGVRVGMLADAGLKSDAAMVLAARSDLPVEQLRRALPKQIKIGPVERIRDLVNVALPGLPVRALPVAPRQLPFRSGAVYFELETSDDLWSEATQGGALAIHLATEIPGLDLELWGIRG
ncbi:type VI secretion system baseplate subunit TssK [Tateyamaria omphalii]|uniref:type VI secretion system baseplate subunit TssK n=1 Tax=Tateyamaria omphalii TaxID=299262 RepID=UPI001C99511A|nr:type VI secretion system baseplate subunit TssK [Tateyamaria omphalii]MBY5931951.1 type VI secretion system baseplate subunit TssK [Tateyamaria omphalii]